MNCDSGRKPFNFLPRQETMSLTPRRSSPIFSVEPPWSFPTSSYTNEVTAPGTGIILSDDPFLARSHQNFQGDSFIDYGALRHDDDSLPVTSPGNVVSSITVSQTTDGAWLTSASATLPPELETSAHNSYQPIHSTLSHMVASSSFMWPVHGPVHTGTVHSLEVLHEDRRTAMLQGSPQSPAPVPPNSSWYPQVEAVGSSATAAFQSPSLHSRPTPPALRHESTPQGSVSRHNETAVIGPQTPGTGSAGYEPASQSPRQRRRASWSSYADRPAKALLCNGIVLDEEDVKETRSINGGLVITYLCRWMHNGQECGMHVMGDRIRLARHIQRWHRAHAEHSERQVPCLWGGCGKVMKRENVIRHVIVTHLKMKWCCSVCCIRLSRDDASARHFERVKSCRHGVATVERGPEAQEVNVRQGVEL
ncbi:uncharacterized protein F5891DRAFT_274288 [Suillus fuscotomentosus]|uniref:C2H2-type domain-containing protein n=1 Tax=Suillus fuscotomentosus TaxID=1912939 RepID=A0AAD4E7T5_9AGAM|nr:uncharacterized protein F5891DRAFT_274288 [Suillus fuscotomentosus]KAG1900947.1 hypothetical protein F5891DRAFT_274288 [Suillus fuscotomentosus]